MTTSLGIAEALYVDGEIHRGDWEPLFSGQGFSVDRRYCTEEDSLVVVWRGAFDAPIIPQDLQAHFVASTFAHLDDPPRIELDFRALTFVNSRLMMFIAKVFYDLRIKFKYFVVRYNPNIGFQRKLFQTLKSMSSSFGSDSYVYFKES